MWRLSFSSLRARLSVVVLVALLPVLGLTVYTGWRQWQQDGFEAEDRVVGLARQFAFAQRELVEGTRHFLFAMTQLPAVRELNAERCRVFLAEEQKLRIRYVNLGVADAQGRVIGSAVSLGEQSSVAEEAWFQEAVRARAFVVGEYVNSSWAGRPLMTAAHPLLDAQGTVQAVVFASLDLGWATHLGGLMELPPGTVVIIFDRDGKILARHPPVEDTREGGTVAMALQRAVAEQAMPGAVRGRERLYGVAPLRVGGSQANTFVAVSIPAAVAYARAQKNLIHDVVVWGIAVLLALLAVQGAGYAFLGRSLRALVSATRRLAEGDLGARVEVAGNEGELEQLGRAFNEMAAALAAQSAQLAESEERFRQVVETSPLGMHFWRLQPDGRLVFTGANRAADEILGIEHTSLIGKGILEAFPSLSGTEVPDRYREACVVGVPWHHEEIRYKDQRVDAALEVFAFRTVPGSMAVMFSDVSERKRALEALRESEKRFRQLFENSPDAIFVEDFDGVVLDVNPAACRLHRLSKEKLVGKHVTELVPPDQREQMARDFARVVSGEWTFFEGNSITASGQVVPVEINVARIDYEGKPALLLHVRDLSNRKRAEIALLESEARFRHLSEATFEGVVLTDMGRILDANSRLVEMLGYRLTELIGKPLASLFAPDAQSNLIEHERSGSGRALEFVIQRKNGTTFPVEVRSRIMPYKGRPVRVVAMRDLTEQKRAQETMQRLATAVEQTVEAIIITDPQGKILYVNRSFEAITGYNRAEVIGKTPRILKSGKHDEAFYRELWETLTRGEVWRGFFFNRKKDGTLYQEEDTITPLKDATGRITSYVAVKRDVTREVALELQLLQSQKMEAIGRLAGGVAHDFNNMLTAITGYGELSKRRLPPGDPLAHNIEEILKAAERASTLTRQLLAFSRKQVLETKLFDLNELITNMQGMLRRLIGEDIELAIALEQPSLWPIKADAGQMEQVIMNLVVNARDAMPLGGKLTLLTANTTVDETFAREHVGLRPGDYVLLSVSDTGVGMSEEVKAHLFEPFFTTKGSDKGTGLGLATCYGIIKQSGGHIIVTSKVGSGTTFDIYLPRMGGETKGAGHAATAAEESPRSKAGETILLVEDEEAVRALAEMVLRELGYQVLSAGNGLEALQLVHQHRDRRIDLLLTDVVMPQMGGRELAERLRKADPNLKVIFTTGYTAEAEWITSSLSREIFYLPKPFTPVILSQKVREALDA